MKGINNYTSYPGNLFVVAAPSGAGKTSLVAALLKEECNIVHSISYTTRPKRPQEQQGINYNFVSIHEFNAMLAQDLFLESAEVFGHYYGTSRESISMQLEQGLDIILEIDWQGAAQIKQLFPESISIFILPPSKEILQHRLHTRKQDDLHVIAHRLAEASGEIKHYNEFDYLIINDDFDTAVNNLKIIVKANRLCQAKQAVIHRKLLAELLGS